MAKNWIKLTGIIKTPVVSKRKRFGIKGIGVVTIHGRPRVFGKLTKGIRRAPMSFRAWYGDVEFLVPEHKLDQALAIDRFGRYNNEGMGHVKWTKVHEVKKVLYTPSKIKIRRMLPKLSDTHETLMTALLLHDFVNTERHPSKIYTEVNILNEEVYKLVKNHHNYDTDEKELPLLSIIQYYDRLSSSISRKFRWSVSSRYRATELEKIDFEGLKKEIELQQHSLYALYTYIRKSEVLGRINEALTYGFSSLKNHLLLMVNLYLDDLRR